MIPFPLTTRATFPHTHTSTAHVVIKNAYARLLRSRFILSFCLRGSWSMIYRVMPSWYSPRHKVRPWIILFSFCFANDAGIKLGCTRYIDYLRIWMLLEGSSIYWCGEGLTQPAMHGQTMIFSSRKFILFGSHTTLVWRWSWAIHVFGCTVFWDVDVFIIFVMEKVGLGAQVYMSVSW